mmetsp:Transcript_46307/g.124426  ORF Transcript_46307/g.124426 Transcript_46307/m.124426 type:complete len:182 (-) Transcript_46307:152-697(-)
MQPNAADVPFTRLALGGQEDAAATNRGSGAEAAMGCTGQRPQQHTRRQRRTVHTTLVVLNLPSPFTAAHLLSTWPADGSFDYACMPIDAMDRRYKRNAVFNFRTQRQAHDFHHKWDGQFVGESQEKPLDIRHAHVQGLHALLERFRCKDLERLNRQGDLPMLFAGETRLSSLDVMRFRFSQ